MIFIQTLLNAAAACIPFFCLFQYIFERPSRFSIPSEKHEWVINSGQLQIFRVLSLDGDGVSALKKVSSYKMLGSTTQSESMLRVRRQIQTRSRKPTMSGPLRAPALLCDYSFVLSRCAVR